MCASQATESAGNLAIVSKESFNEVECNPFTSMICSVQDLVDNVDTWILTNTHCYIVSLLYARLSQPALCQKKEVGRVDLDHQCNSMVRPRTTNSTLFLEQTSVFFSSDIKRSRSNSNVSASGKRTRKEMCSIVQNPNKLAVAGILFDKLISNQKSVSTSTRGDLNASVVQIARMTIHIYHQDQLI